MFNVLHTTSAILWMSLVIKRLETNEDHALYYARETFLRYYGTKMKYSSGILLTTYFCYFVVSIF